MTGRKRCIMTAAMAAALLGAAAFARQAPPATSPAPAVPRGDWFSAAANPSTQAGPETDAQVFARLYPELARYDKASRAVTPRVLFDAMGSHGKPLLKLPIMIGVYNADTDASLREFKASKPLDPALLVPDERHVRIGAVMARQNAGSLFLDVENRSLDARVASPAEIDRSIAVIAKMVGWARAQDPNLRLFFYAGFPLGENYLGPNRAMSATTKPGGASYDWWKANTAKFEAQRDRWREANALVSPLAAMFDATCPSLYLYPYDELTETTTAIPGFVRETVNEARRYGKPVYPFVWYLLCDTTTPVPLKQWTTLMREVLTWADGAVLWDGPTVWNNRLALRVRIAMVIADRKGQISDAEIYDLIRADFPGDAELSVLRGETATTQPTTQPATPSATKSPAETGAQQTR